MESLKQEVKALDRYRSQITNKADQLLADRCDLENETAALALQVKQSTTQTEVLQQQLTSRNNEVDVLGEKNRVLDRELAAATRDATTKQDIIASLEEALHREKRQSEQYQKALNESNDKLAESRIENKTLSATVERLRSELKATVEDHKGKLVEFTQQQTKLLSSLKHEHADLEKTITRLQRVNSELEIERTKLSKDKQCSLQRGVVLEKLLADKTAEHEGQMKVITSRVHDAEAQLDTCLIEKQALAKQLECVEEQLKEVRDLAKELELSKTKIAEKLRGELLFAKQDNEHVANRMSKLQNDLETARRLFENEKEKMKDEVKHKIEEARMECESLKVLRSKEQLKAKESRAAYEKSVALHQATVERMKIEANDVRLELEKTISDERNISQVIEVM